ncbi:MAG: hypothetical protein K2L07_10030 [Lachnospiraceae bacterium]|nr:hypothetical protein [Lachnospiraceae bacterium]
MEKIYRWLLAVCFLVIAFTVPVKAAEPKVMVTDYKVKEDKITAGGEFELSVTIYNTAKKNVKNMKVAVLSEAGELLPAKGAGTAYIEQLNAETEETLVFQMAAANGLEEKSYKLMIKLNYEDNYGSPYAVEDAIYLPLQLEQRYSLTDLTIDGKFILGEELEITGMVNNLGKGTLYNVTVKTSGDNISEKESYIGNIEPGKSGSLDMIVEAKHLSDGTQRMNYITVIYEDEKGNKQEKQEKLEQLGPASDIAITAPVYENLEKVKEEKTDTKTGKITLIVGIVFALAVLIFWLSYRKWKRKKKILEEF